MNDIVKNGEQNSEATAQAEKITELLKDEQYIYQGKVYSHKSLYKTSSLKTVVFIIYGTVVFIGVLGVVWWTYLKPIGIGSDIQLPSFLVGTGI